MPRRTPSGKNYQKPFSGYRFQVAPCASFQLKLNELAKCKAPIMRASLNLAVSFWIHLHMDATGSTAAGCAFSTRHSLGTTDKVEQEEQTASRWSVDRPSFSSKITNL